MSFFIFLFNKDISKEDKIYIDEAKEWKFNLNKKDICKSKSIITIQGFLLVFYTIVEIILSILFIPFDI